MFQFQLGYNDSSLPVHKLTTFQTHFSVEELAKILIIPKMIKCAIHDQLEFVAM